MVDFGRSRAGVRLRDLITPQLVDDEQLKAWTRAWISRDGRYNWLLGSRHRDYVVLTDRRLVLWSCGFFTRRPLRKVFDEWFERIVVEDTGRTPLRRLQVTGFQRKPLRFDLGSGLDSAEVAAALVRPKEGDTCPS